MKKQLTKNDILWSYGASFMSIGSGIVILPIILSKLSVQEIAINYLLISINTFIALFDLSFSSQFARNIAYVFNGAKELKKEGFDNLCDADEVSDIHVDYQLLSELIATTKYVYKRFAIVAISLLFSVGSLYIYLITNHFTSIKSMIWIWIGYCISVYFNIYYLYYGPILIGRSCIKEAQKSFTFSKLFNRILSIVLIYCGLGLASIVIANIVAPFVYKFFSHYYFFQDGIKQKLQRTVSSTKIKVLFSTLRYNLQKLSLVTITTNVIAQIGLFFSGLCLPLEDVASYGLMMQLVNALSVAATMLITIQIPTFASYRIMHDNDTLIKKFASAMVIFYALFCFGSLFFLYAASPTFAFIKSKVFLPAPYIVFIYCITKLLESNHTCFTNVIASSNSIPYLKASLWSNLFIIIGYSLLTIYPHWGLFGFVLVPGIVQIVYQNWKWPKVVLNEFHLNYFQFLWIGNVEIAKSTCRILHR